MNATSHRHVRQRRIVRVATPVAIAAAAAVTFLTGCGRQTDHRQESAASETPSRSRPTPSPAERVVETRIVRTAWYDVPEDSLAKERAEPREFTAAHNELPIGTRVRVTHLTNGKSTIVRITDRGIHSSRVRLDVCREAAEELGIISKGIARVRMEVLADDATPVSGGSVSLSSREE